MYTTKNTTDLILKNYTESKNRKIKEETTMKAMYIDAPGQVSIKDVEMPVRKEGEVLLKILTVESAEAILVPTVEHSHI